jgi:chaperone required for assembly of F1-ATPase
MSLPGHSAERMRRFYKAAETAPAEGGFAVRLDGRQPRSPQGQALVLPTEALARLVADEWAAQGENILPETMPATRLAWGALALGDEGVRAGAVARVASFAESDLLCYFADGPPSLVERQERRWGAVIDWAEAALGTKFHRTQGVVHQPQPPETIARIEALAVAEDDFRLAGLTAAAALFGSAILAFALHRGELTAEAAFELSRLDETFQEERWGVDAEAAARADAMAKEAMVLGAWFVGLGDMH